MRLVVDLAKGPDFNALQKLKLCSGVLFGIFGKTHYRELIYKVISELTRSAPIMA